MLPYFSLFLDILLVKTVDLISEVKTGKHLGHRHHKVIEFKIFVDRTKSVSKPSTLDRRRTNFRLLRQLVIISWEKMFLTC